MAGIYIHIPFCRQKCHYCDFHFSISHKLKDDLLKALHKEIELRKEYLQGERADTIYFGGGTPSVLSKNELDQLLLSLHRHFTINSEAEVTLEANPDDLNKEYLKNLYELGINRLSIGIQSFIDDHLRTLNRIHNAELAINSVKNAQDIGYDNINIDLIYGLPQLNNQKWIENLDKAFTLNIQHISSYHLTIEPQTAFHHFVQKGKIKLPEEEESLVQFKTLMERTAASGFEHYEISNFAKKGFLSKHNTNYWLQKKYLGIGPSAHSYNLETRQWNIANNTKYIEKINKEENYFEIEQLTTEDQYNDYILTSLRTIWGTDLLKIKNDFGEQFHRHSLKEAGQFIKNGELLHENNTLKLTQKGKFIADKIASDLFVV